MQYAILGILVVAFIAFVVLSAKSWHWSNIVFLVLTFLTGLGAIIVMAQVLDARYKDMLSVQKFSNDLERVESEIQTVVYGPGFSYEYSPDSLRGLSETLNLETAGRGRVWRSGAIEIKDDNRVFKFSGDRLQSADNPTDMKDMLLFVYADRILEEIKYPVLFVGTMRVVGETGSSIEMEPVFVANTEEYAQPTQTWTLFEKSPTDQRDAFIRNTDIELDVDSDGLNEQLTAYRKLLVEQFLPVEIFDFDLSDPDEARQYEYLIDRVMFDGLPLVKIENWLEAQPERDRITPRFDPPQEEVFVRFQFQDKSNRSYQVDSTGNIETDGQFTRNGQAVDPALHAGGEIDFQKGDEIIVDQLTADGYQRGDEPVPSFPSVEPVNEVSRVFVRQLSDFPFLLKTLQRQTVEYGTEIERVAENNRRSEVANADAIAQLDKREEVIEQLGQDQDKLKADVMTVRKFADNVKMKKMELESDIGQSERDIREQHRRIKAMVRAIRESSGNVSQTISVGGG